MFIANFLPLLNTAGIGILAFVSTNLDDLLILILLFSNAIASSRPSTAIPQVVIGQFLGMAILVLGSALLGTFAQELSSRWVAALALIPIGIGVKLLLERRKIERRWIRGGVTEASLGLRQNRGQVGLISTVVLTLVNGGDNLGVYLPFFVDRSLEEQGVLGIVFMLMTALWCGLAYYLVHHPRLKRMFAKGGTFLFPWVLIFLGGFLLFFKLR